MCQAFARTRKIGPTFFPYIRLATDSYYLTKNNIAPLWPEAFIAAILHKQNRTTLVTISSARLRLCTSSSSSVSRDKTGRQVRELRWNQPARHWPAIRMAQPLHAIAVVCFRLQFIKNLLAIWGSKLLYGAYATGQTVGSPYGALYQNTFLWQYIVR